jgi:hypothetical protein
MLTFFFVEFEKPLMHRSNVNFGALDVTIPSDSTSENNSDIKTIQQIPVKICHKKVQNRNIPLIYRTEKAKNMNFQLIFCLNAYLSLS